MPQSPEILTQADKYATAYFLLLKAEDPAMQARIKAAKENPDVKDDRLNAFIKRVCEMAEQETPQVVKKT